jgi:hypothetical protein
MTLADLVPPRGAIGNGGGQTATPASPATLDPTTLTGVLTSS